MLERKWQIVAHQPMYTWLAEVIPKGWCARLQVACLCQSHYRQLFHSFCPVHCIPLKSLPIYELSTMSIVRQKEPKKKLKEDFGTALQTNYLRQKVKSRQSLSNQIIRSSNYLVGLNSAQTKKHLNAISYWYQRIERLPRIVGHPHMGRCYYTYSWTGPPIPYLLKKKNS